MVALLETDVTTQKRSFLGRPAAPLGLRIVSAERAGHVVRLAAGKCTIGSAPGCTLRLRGRGFQPLHCVILRGPGGAAVRRWSGDTRLNGGQFLTATLKVGDRLAFGHVEFEVVELAEETVFDASAERPTVAPAVALANVELIDSLTQNKQQLSDELELARQDKQQLCGELEIAREETNRFCAELETVRGDKQRYCDELESAREDKQRLNTELESVRGSQEVLAAKVDELTAVVATEQSARESLVQAKQEAVAVLEQRLAAQASVAEALQADWNNQRQALELTAQAALVELQHEREARALTGDQAQAEWDRQRQALETAARDAAAQWQNERMTLAAAAQQAQALWTSEREALEATARETATLWQNERQALEASRQAAEAQWNSERQGFESSLQNAEREINQLRHSLADAAQQVAPAPVEDHVTSAALQQLRQDRDAATSRAAALQRRCDEQAASETDLRDEIERLSGAVTALSNAPQTTSEPKQGLEQLAHLKQMSDELAVREAAFAERVKAVEAREEQINNYVDELTGQQADLENERITLLEQQAAWKETQKNSPTAVPAEGSPEPPAVTECETAERSDPVDVSNILARLGRAEGASEQADKPREFAALEPARTPEPIVAERPALSSETDEDSIEAYMARLLNRVRGEAEPLAATTPRASYVPVAKPVSTVENAEPAATLTDEQILARASKPAQLVPRTVARERTENLAAMRELANQSARGHLDTHNKLQWGRAVAEKSIIAGASLGCGFALLVSPIFETSVLTACGGVVSLGTGIAWTVQAIRTYKEGKAAQKLAEQSRTGLEPPLASDVADPTSELTADEAAACEQR